MFWWYTVHMPPPHNSQYKFHVHLFDNSQRRRVRCLSCVAVVYLSPLLSVSLSSRKTRCEVWWIGLQWPPFIGTPAKDSPNLAALFTIPSRRPPHPQMPTSLKETLFSEPERDLSLCRRRTEGCSICRCCICWFLSTYYYYSKRFWFLKNH